MIEPQLSDHGPPRATPTTLRQFAGLWLVFFGGFAAWQAWSNHVGAAIALAVVAAVVGLPGLAKPEAVRGVFATISAVTLPIGKLVSFVLLSAFFYVVFAPIGAAFKLFGRDPLALRRPAGASSYLTAKRSETAAANYFRQS
jgi:hypothetical protein